MARLLLSTCLLVVAMVATTSAQDDLILQKAAYFSYTISFEGDTLTYYMGGGTQNSDPKKLVLFLQGSMPQPLFVQEEDGTLTSRIPISPMDYAAEYYLCIIPKPGIPAVAKRTELDELDMYLDQETGEMIRAYQERNHLGYYVRSREAVLRDIASKVELEEIVIVGGSEGARVGARLSLVSELVTHLVYFSSDPFGRYYHKITDLKARMMRGELSRESGQDKIEKVLQEWKEINKAPLLTAERLKDTNRAWVSFSDPPINDLLSLEIPVLVAYGTADEGVTNMEVLRLEAIRQQKDNIHFRAYLNHDHFLNKSVFDENDQKIRSEFVFDKIYEEWMQWVKAH